LGRAMRKAEKGGQQIKIERFKVWQAFPHDYIGTPSGI
jgi:hypothetical protein